MSQLLAMVVTSAILFASQQKLPSQVSAGQTVEVCGVVSAVSPGRDRCDASLQVETASEKFTILVPAALRRAPEGKVRPFQGAEACFNGVAETAGDRMQVRVTDASAIRVVKPAPSDESGIAGVADMCDAGVTAPRLLADVKPDYTEQAMRARIAGAVGLEAVVLPTGEVGAVRVTKSLEKSLDEQAVKALKQWKFAPGTVAGKPVPVLVSVEMTFALRKR